MKKIVGITGSIGSGKTYVSKKIEEKGFPVFYFDAEAKELYYEREIREQIVSLLGEASYKGDVPNFEVIASCVFQDGNLLRKVQEALYPSLRERFFKWVEQQKTRIVFCEAAIFIESGFYKYTDKLLTIYSPLLIRIKRLQKREKTDNFSTFARRMEKQLPPSYLFRYSDYILFNDGICSVEEQIISLLKKI